MFGIEENFDRQCPPGPTISLHLYSFQLCFSNWQIKQSDSAWMRMFELFVITYFLCW